MLIYREGEVIKNFGKISEISDDIFEKLSIKNNGEIVKCFTNNDKKDLFNGKFFRLDSLLGQQFELKKEIEYNDLHYFNEYVINRIEKKSEDCSNDTKKILDDRFEENLIHFYCCKENINESEIDRKEIIELIRTNLMKKRKI